IIAGPPCKGFSLIRVSRRNPEDERNTLFEEVVRALRIISPDLLIMENVPGLLSMDTPEGDSVKDVILKRIKKEGYNCKMTKILASDFEVPQDRERIFFIAHKNKEIDFPDIIEDKNTVKDAIGNIPNPEKDYCKEPQTEYQEKMTREDRKLYNHKGVNHSDRVIERMKYIPQGGNWRDIPEEENDLNCKYSNAYKRLNLDKPSITITNSMIIHPNENRKISVREMARLQSFPDDFVFKGSKSHQSQQIINAVPPLLAYHLAKYYKDYI
ncbi:MAG: DNA cytosine methyltransferase, partial [archaeon]